MASQLDHRLANAYRAWRYHRIVNGTARQALDALARRDRIRLTTQVKRTCDQYAIEVLGGQIYAPWLYVYHLLNQTFREGWISPNYYYLRICPGLKSSYGVLYSRKTLGNLLYECNYFPNLIHCINGLYFDDNRRYYTAQEALGRLQEQAPVVFKSDGLGRGEGVQICDPQQLAALFASGPRNGVFQSYVRQHPDLARFIPGSVATMRLTTILNDAGQAELRSAYIRFGRTREAHLRSDSNLRIPVDPQNGILDEYGYDARWEKIDRHPDTQVAFAGARVPSFPQARAIALELQARAPYTRCIGWDLTTDESGRVHVLEANADNNGIQMCEIGQGPCFADLITPAARA